MIKIVSYNFLHSLNCKTMFKLKPKNQFILSSKINYRYLIGPIKYFKFLEFNQHFIEYFKDVF